MTSKREPVEVEVTVPQEPAPEPPDSGDESDDNEKPEDES